MNTFRNTLKAVRRGPFEALLICALVFGITFLDYNNPLYKLIFGFGAVNPGNVFYNIIYLFEMLLKPVVLLKVIVLLAGTTLLLSAISGLLLSAYFNILNGILNETEGLKRKFLNVIKKNFSRIFLMTLIIIIVFILFVIVAIVSITPGLALTSSFISGRKDMLLPMILIDFITLYALFFALMFFRAHFFFWFPASINYNIKPFKIAKHAVDNNFRTVVGNLIVFDAVFIFYSVIFLLLRLSKDWPLGTLPGFVQYFVNSSLNVLFVLVFFTWTFTSFRKFMQKEI